MIDSLAAGQDWGRYDNSKWRPNYKQADLDLPWLLDNSAELWQALQVLKDQPTGGNDAGSNGS